MLTSYDSAIIYYLYNSNLNGSIINAYEYFLCAFEYNPDIKLIFVDGDRYSIDHFTRMVKDRYTLEGVENFENNVIIFPRRELMWKRFGRLLTLDYGSVHKLKGLISTRDLIVITEVKPDDEDMIFSKELYPVTYYGEMPFHYWDVEYRMKFLFDRYKPLKHVNEAIYINSPSNKDLTFLEEIDLPDKPILVKERQHKNNLFESFDTYVYYHANKWFDPHPRMFLECAFYEKDIYYFNKYNIKDGSYYRYEDLKKNGLKNRTLTKDDEIIRKLI
jgi:hypothetical protein